MREHLGSDFPLLVDANMRWRVDQAVLAAQRLSEYDLVWLEGNKYFTWTSERDGWRHLYKVSLDGKEITQITRGAFDMVSLACVEPRSGYAYYIASPDNPTQRPPEYRGYDLFTKPGQTRRIEAN